MEGIGDGLFGYAESIEVGVHFTAVVTHVNARRTSVRIYFPLTNMGGT